MRYAALYEQTAALPFIEPAIRSLILGLPLNRRSRNGVQLGILCELEAVIARMNAFLPNLKVVLTGGDSYHFENDLKTPIFAHPLLVLEDSMRSYFSTIRIRSVLVIVLGALSITAIAQPSNDSPYSRYGIGNITDFGSIRSAGLGGLNVALDKVDERQVNYLNPASYVDMDSQRVVLDASVNWTIADAI